MLSGETGAGKSIIVGALSLLMGERASSDLVRQGESRALIEGCFDISARPDLLERLEEAGLDSEDGWLILRRELQKEGRNRAWVNGSPATAVRGDQQPRGGERCGLPVWPWRCSCSG